MFRQYLMAAFAIAACHSMCALAEKDAAPAGKHTNVVAEGVGLTVDDARKDAFRSAVRQVVGAMIDAETLVKNDQIVADEVLTFSAGMVKGFKK